MNITRTILALSFCLIVAVTASAQRGPDGGDRGGGGFRGGPPGFGGPGGDRGGRGGGGDRGGFDPSGFLSRLDANGNGILDPEEQQGPAQFLIQRMQQTDSSIKAGQPISIKKVTESFNKMREQRESGNDPRASRGGSSTADDAMKVELLVQGFGIDDEPIPLKGFGAAAEMLSVPVTDADRKEAAELMRRYDRNKDGYLAKDELSSRMSGNPMDFDRNKDGKLTANELAVRYARRREGEETAQAAKKKDSRRDDRRRNDKEEVDPYDGRQSYRITDARKLPEGLPGFFSDKDANGDGQVEMAEFASDWNDDVIAEFFKSDLNRDGTITASEALRAVEQGVSVTVASSGGNTGWAGSGGTHPSGASIPANRTSPGAASGNVGKPDEKYVKYAERIIGRYDKNKDGALVASEWSSMLMNPSGADANRDGRVTIDEYAWSMQSRSKKK